MYLVYLVPMFRGPDEKAHFHYISYLNEHARIPVWDVSRRIEPDYNEYYQPPLYYVSASLFLSLFSADTEYAQAIILRFFSVMIWICSMGLLLWFLSVRLALSRWQTITVFSIFSFLPSYMGLNILINNDNAVLFLALCFMFSMYEKEKRGGSLIPLGVLFALCLMTKLSVISLAILWVPLLLFYWKRRSRARFVREIFMLFFVGSVLCSGYFIHNWMSYGYFFPEKLFNVSHRWPRLFLVYVFFPLKNLLQTFFCAFGKTNENHPAPFIPKFLILFLVAGFYFRPKITASVKKYIQLAAAVLSAQLLLLFRFSYHYNQAQGRFFSPYLPLITLFIILSLSGWQKKFLRCNVYLLFSLFLFLYACYYCYSVYAAYADPAFWLVELDPLQYL